MTNIAFLKKEASKIVKSIGKKFQETSIGSQMNWKKFFNDHS